MPGAVKVCFATTSSWLKNHVVLLGFATYCTYVRVTLNRGGAQTIERYHGNPRVQAHGPGFSKILLGDDVVDDWEKYIDLMADSIFLNSGRSCISASGVWASRHTEAIAEALAKRLGPVEPRPMNDPAASLAAFTVQGAAKAINAQIEDLLNRDDAPQP